MSVIITSTEIPDSTSLLFSVVSGGGSNFQSEFVWYLNGTPVSTKSTYTLVNPISGDSVYVKLKNYSEPGCLTYWYDGHFYGGTFTGNFSGGAFHYGILNGEEYLNQSIKPKVFKTKT